jgi:ankyrin repeat protein
MTFLKKLFGTKTDGNPDGDLTRQDAGGFRPEQNIVGAKAVAPFHDQLIEAALLDGDIVRIRALLKDNPDRVFSTDPNGVTPLHMASQLGRDDAVLLLLKSKADVNAKDNSGFTPLHYATMLGRGRGAAKILLESGADVNAKNISGQTPLQLALIMNHHVPTGDLVGLLLSHGGNE